MDHNPAEIYTGIEHNAERVDYERNSGTMSLPKTPHPTSWKPSLGNSQVLARAVILKFVIDCEAIGNGVIPALGLACILIFC